MLRKIVAALAVGAGALTVALTFRNPANGVAVAQPREEQAKDGKQTVKLPITQVVMFNSGVGYFQRSGEVTGDARVELLFPAGGINDLIKTLIVSDGKGKTAPIRYDSQEPVEKALKSFGVDLSYNPSYGQLINQTRGEQAEVTFRGDAGPVETLRGAILGMETATQAVDNKPVERELLNLMTPEGLRNLPLDRIVKVKFLNTALEQELKRALEVVASGHDSQKKAVRFGFRGEGKREVRVGYVAEHPIWKTSYRIRLDDNGKDALQGWATVENTTDEDWNDVRLALVTTRPISYRMDMYPPLHIPRPLVEPSLYASLRPPTYAGPMAPGGFGANVNGNFVGGGFGGGFGGNDPNAAGTGPQGGFQALQNTFQGQQNVNLGSQGGNLGQGGGFSGNRYQNPNYFDPNRLTYEDFIQRKQQAENAAKEAAKEAAEVGSVIGDVDPKLIEAALAAGELGTPARFTIEEKVTLPRQQSTMIPLFDAVVETERVSIYNPRVQAKHPLSGLRIKNPTKQTLMSGPVTVYHGDQYAGESRFLDLQPGEQRFLSYAVDVGIEVKPYEQVKPAPDLAVSVREGRLHVSYHLRSTRTYAVKNNSPEDRTIVIEQPIRTGWKLAAGQEVMETTRDLFRFKVPVKSGQLVKFEVKEDLPSSTPYAVSQRGDWKGYSTQQDLDAWTTDEPVPEDKVGLRFEKDKLVVVHRHRTRRTYHFLNKAPFARKVELTHYLSPADERLADEKPDPSGRRYVRFTLDLPAAPAEGEPKPVTQEVLEQYVNPTAQPFGLVALDAGAWAGAADQPAHIYAPPLGFQAWRFVDPATSVLREAKLVKGKLELVHDQRTKQVMTLRNVSKADKAFTLLQPVPPGGRVVGDEKPAVPFDTVREYDLKVPAGESKSREILLETQVRSTLTFEELAAQPDGIGRALLASDKVPEELRRTLTRGLEMLTDLRADERKLEELTKANAEIMEEQARVRRNVTELPNTAPVYKRFLDKVDELETALEKSRLQFRDLVNARQRKQAEYEAFTRDLRTK